MKNRLEKLAGTPHRVRALARPEATRDIDLPSGSLDDVVPATFRVEVRGGRSSTASVMRAARVQHALEAVGASARTVELEGEHATLRVEADRPQIELAARLPFVRRIRLS